MWREGRNQRERGRTTRNSREVKVERKLIRIGEGTVPEAEVSAAGREW